jgi:hypothetical protein
MDSCGLASFGFLFVFGFIGVSKPFYRKAAAAHGTARPPSPFCSGAYLARADDPVASPFAAKQPLR